MPERRQQASSSGVGALFPMAAIEVQRHRGVLAPLPAITRWTGNFRIIVVFANVLMWRRGLDSNPRAGYPTRRSRGVPVTTTSVPLREADSREAHLYL